MEYKFIITLVHFIQIVLPLLLYECKDQSLVKRTYTIIFVFRIELENNSSSFQVVISDVRDSKFNRSPPEKENTGSVAQLSHNFLGSIAAYN